MRGKRFSEEQIIGILKEHESGVSAKEIGRKYGISSNTIYNWKAKYAGLTVNEAKRLRCLEDENRRLKKLVADLSLDVQMLKDVNSKNW